MKKKYRGTKSDEFRKQMLSLNSSESSNNISSTTSNETFDNSFYAKVYGGQF